MSKKIMQYVYCNITPEKFRIIELLGHQLDFHFESCNENDKYAYIINEDYDKEICTNNELDKEYTKVTFEKFLLEMSKPTCLSLSVELNSGYTAVFDNRETFSVGCQHFALDVIDELVKAKEEILEE